MSQELLNTSAPRGVKPGSAGFCTVGMTAGMPAALEERLSLLSGYRWLVPPGEAGAESNPVAFAHWRMAAGGRSLDVLSRVCDAGFDYSGRSNRFAHHVIVDSAEQSGAGPAWLMLHGGFMRGNFNGEPAVFPSGPEIPSGDNHPRICEHWRAATGDAGWAGALAESFAADPSRTAYVIYSPGMDMLPLIDEAIALLPPPMRWQVTFSTYFTDLPAGLSCAWRCCIAGTKAASEAPRHATSGVVLDLTRALGQAPTTSFTTAARTGTAAAAPVEIEQPSDAWGAAEQDDLQLAPVAAEIQESPEAEADQSWMPPLGATVVEDERPLTIAISRPPLRAAQREDSGSFPTSTRPAGTRVLFWGLALVWPVIVGVGVWYYVRNAPIRTVVVAQSSHKSIEEPPHQATETKIGMIPTSDAKEQYDKFTSSIKTLTDQVEKVTKDRDEAVRSAIAAKKDSGVLRARADSLDRQVTIQQKEIVQLKQSLPASQPAAAPVKVIMQPTDRAVEVMKDEIELWSSDENDVTDRIEFREAYPAPQGLEVESDNTHTTIFQKPPVPPSGEVSPPRNILARIRIDPSQRVLLTWTSSGSKTDLAKIAGAENWLRLAEVVCYAGDRKLCNTTLTPRRILKSVVTAPQIEQVAVPEIHGGDEAVKHISLVAFAPQENGWGIESVDAHTLRAKQLKVPRATFLIRLDTSKRNLRPEVTWFLERQNQSQASQTAANELKRAQQTHDDASKNIPIIQKQLNDEKVPENQNNIKTRLAAALKQDQEAVKSIPYWTQEQKDAKAAVEAFDGFLVLHVRIVRQDTRSVLSTLVVESK